MTGADPMTSPDPRFGRPACLFYGIGAQKAGTTWLHRYLGTHPGVKITALKEQHYWESVRPPHHDFILPRTPWARAVQAAKTVALPPYARLTGRLRSEEWAYRQRAVAYPRADHRDHASALFCGWRGEAAVGEITPDYCLLSAGTFAEMAALSPNARFFFVLRDPLARAMSALRMQTVRATMFEYKPDIPPADRLARALDGRDPALLRYSDYKATITALEAAVPRERIAYFFYETLFDQAEIDRLTDFLGVGPHPANLGNVVNRYEDEIGPLPEDAVAEVSRRLEPVYAFVRGRFGAAIPGNWQG